MAANKVVVTVSEPSWGEEIAVLDAAPADYRPGAKGWVVGMRTITERDEQFTFNPLGTRLLTIEFEDGSSVEIPAEFVRTIGEGKPDTR